MATPIASERKPGHLGSATRRAEEGSSMSAAPIHADNAAQSEYWNASAGQRWTDY
jgi:hypothetical protein